MPEALLGIGSGAKSGDKQVAALFATLGNTQRIKLLRLIAAQGQVTVTEARQSLEVSQSSCSFHLLLMMRQGLLEVTRQHRHRFYRIAPEALQMMAAFVIKLQSDGKINGRKK